MDNISNGCQDNIFEWCDRRINLCRTTTWIYENWRREEGVETEESTVWAEAST